MAKRRRLTPSAFAPETEMQTVSDTAPMPEVRACLRPGLATGAAPPIARVAAESSAEAALAEVSEAMRRARAEGRLVERLPLAAVETDHLLRDRIETDEEEMGHLVASIQAHGQRTPIEVTELAPGRYGLISGWRRIKALTRLFETTGEPRFATVEALLRRPETAADAYVAMIEENEIRLGLSYYERARIAARAADLGVFESEKQSLQRLFAAASRARRSKIGSFLQLYRRLDDVLRFPAAIPERLGLALVQALEGACDGGAALRADLASSPAASAPEEQARLARFISTKTGSATAVRDEKPARQELRPGLFVTMAEGRGGAVLSLSGPAVDPALRDRLLRWLAQEG